MSVRRGFHPLALLAIGLFVLVVGAAGTIGILEYFGVVDLARLFHKAAGNSYAGMIQVPASGMPIPAYTTVTREHLLYDPHTGSIRAFFYMSPKNVSKKWITDDSKIVGRVMAHDKPAGRPFVEADFFPKGTRPGLVGGIPPGKRAMTLDANQVRGLKDLRIGDHFDLISSEPVDMKGLQPQVRWKLSGKSSNRVGSAFSAAQKATVIVLIDDGVVVTRPAPSRTASRQPTAGIEHFTGPDPGPARRNEPREMTIALSPDEVAPVTEALATKASLYCVARSGNPNDTQESKIRENDPLENVSVIETMRGQKFGMEAFPISNYRAPEASKPARKLPLPVSPAESRPGAQSAGSSSAPASDE